MSFLKLYNRARRSAKAAKPARSAPHIIVARKYDEAGDLLSPRCRDRRDDPRKLLRRYAALDPQLVRAVADGKSDVLEVAFSSDTDRVRRWDWELGECPEILVHESGAADLAPVLDAGSVLRNHDPNQPIAKPVSARIDQATARGIASLRWGTTECAKNARQEVADEILRGVSFGYEPLAIQRVKPGATFDLAGRAYKGPCVLFTRWSVYELTLTTIPADPSVGVGKK